MKYRNRKWLNRKGTVSAEVYIRGDSRTLSLRDCTSSVDLDFSTGVYSHTRPGKGGNKELVKDMKRKVKILRGYLDKIEESL
jgi:hypothetical protein